MIEINNVSFSYTKKPVLKNVSLSIVAGERWAVIGRNGAGKSTLIRCIAGLERQYSGSVNVGNSDINSLRPRALAKILAYVPQVQNRSLYYSVYDYVMMGRFPYQGFMATATVEDKRCVAEALELTDTASFADRPMNTLSGGEQQRVLLAGAVSQRTDILLLDEPTTFLDPLHQELIQETLERIHGEYNCTVLTVTHDINAALFRNDNVLALKDGSVFYAGSPDKIIESTPSMLRDIFGISFVKGICKENGRAFVMPE
jgi:iron complex transport system ATP-binding protein